MQPKTIVYIDGFNFYFGLLKGSPHKWLNIEQLFLSMYESQNRITEINYYTARVSPTPRDPDVANRQDAYLRALDKTCPLLKVHYGHFLRHKVTMENASPPPASCEVYKNEEKGSDVNLAVHLINDAWRDRYDVAVVVSNDSDLAEALRIVKSEKSRTIGLVTPGAPQRKTSRQLLKHADFVKPIRTHFLVSSQLPNRIPGTNITKPAGW